MVKHNNRLVKNHFKKDWERHVKTWFDQPAKKLKRRKKRHEKAVKIFPRPVTGLLRPLVHGQTLKYQAKIRFGRGFSLEELKLAKIPVKEARTIGIAVDHRRNNRSLEIQTANVQRLNLYKSKLVIFPRKPGHPKKGDSSQADLEAVVQQTEPFPYKIVEPRDKARAITEKEKTDSAYITLRKARGEANKVGDKIRKARAEALGTAAAGASKKPAADEGDDEEGGKKKAAKGGKKK